MESIRDLLALHRKVSRRTRKWALAKLTETSDGLSLTDNQICAYTARAMERPKDLFCNSPVHLSSENTAKVLVLMFPKYSKFRMIDLINKELCLYLDSDETISIRNYMIDLYEGSKSRDIGV